MIQHLEHQIKQYLYFGYLPANIGYDWLLEPLASAPSVLPYTTEQASRVLDSVFDKLLSSVGSNTNIVVPVSGGWDSRIVLGACLERVDARQIKTFSYGVPGAFDYEIGAKVADAVGVEHHRIDLSQLTLTWTNLKHTALQKPWVSAIDTYFNDFAMSSVAISDRDIILSGFMGDPLTGGHISESITAQEALEEFIISQKYEKELNVYPLKFNPRSAVPCLPELSPIPFSELLDFGIRQSSCVAPVVTPLQIWNKFDANVGRLASTGATVIAPFIDPDWAAYWMLAPKAKKNLQVLYLEMMRYKFPKIANLPSKYSLGELPSNSWKIRLRRLQLKKNKLINELVGRSKSQFFNPLENYLNFTMAFETKEDYRELISLTKTTLESVNHSFKEHPDLNAVYGSVINGNHTKSMQLLIGLAVNISNAQEANFGKI